MEISIVFKMCVFLEPAILLGVYYKKIIREIYNLYNDIHYNIIYKKWEVETT